MIKTHFQCSSRHTTLTARGNIGIRPCLSFNTTVSSFSDRPRHLPKHMVVAQTDLPPPTIFRCIQTTSNPAAIGIAEERESKTLLTEIKVFGFNDTVGVVQYKAPAGRATQMEGHIDVQNEDTKCLAHGWREEMGIADKYA